jgi:glutamate 5-kinase
MRRKRRGIRSADPAGAPSSPISSRTAVFHRTQIPATRRWIIKIGSALLTRDGAGLDPDILATWIAQMAALRGAGREVVLVSSGAVAQGMARMGWHKRPQALHELQAAAAIGQMGLIRAYEDGFSRHGLHTAQVLLTRDDLADRKRYLNARSTLRTLLGIGVFPVVNENDTVATDELRFGDNDTLAALVANLVEAELLILLTDQDGLFTANPHTDPNAALIREARVDDVRLDQAAGGSNSALGTGGMVTKLRAARLAARSGCATVIAPGRRADSLTDIASGDLIGSLLVPTQGPQAARKRWLAGHLSVRGRLARRWRRAGAAGPGQEPAGRGRDGRAWPVRPRRGGGLRRRQRPGGGPWPDQLRRRGRATHQGAPEQPVRGSARLHRRQRADPPRQPGARVDARTGCGGRAVRCGRDQRATHSPSS